MVKKLGLSITLMIVILLGVGNTFLFFSSGNYSYANFTGMFVREIPELPLNLNISLVAFIIQWFILLGIAIVAYVKFVRRKLQDNLKISYSSIIQDRGRFETDFDTLYKLLQQKKKLRIGVISGIFEISHEQALDWSKILEENGLVTIEYPAFSEPEVNINENKGVNKEGDKKEEISEVSKVQKPAKPQQVKLEKTQTIRKHKKASGKPHKTRKARK